MRTAISILASLVALSLATLLSSAAIAAIVDITFVAPEHYTDGGGKGGLRDVPTKEAVEREIRAHFVNLAGHNLAPNQTLKIEILDIDLAGRRDVLGAGVNDIRVYDELNSPRIKLRYALEEDGHAVLNGEEALADPLYLNSLAPSSTGDPLRYERPMLTKWFLARIVERKPHA
jgi:hypothetical protein